MEKKSMLKQFVVFKICEEEYGIDILRVKTIEKMSAITRVPKTPNYVKGVVNLRGEVVPIIDLRQRFATELCNFPSLDTKGNLEKEGILDKSLPNQITFKETEDTRIIIVNADDVVVGLIVDSASEVIEIDNNLIEDPPESMGDIEVSGISGIGKLNDRIIIILDVYKMLNV